MMFANEKVMLEAMFVFLLNGLVCRVLSMAISVDNYVYHFDNKLPQNEGPEQFGSQYNSLEVGNHPFLSYYQFRPVLHVWSENRIIYCFIFHFASVCKDSFYIPVI